MKGYRPLNASTARKVGSKRGVKRPAKIPPCAAFMGCLCAGHARGNPADAPCDTREYPWSG